MLKGFFGAFLGKLAAACFIALCIIFGFGPDQWVIWMLADLPKYITPESARAVFIFLGASTLLALLWRPVGKIFTRPIILAKLETTVSPIGDFTPACAIRVTNTGPELEEKCLVQIEGHELKMLMPDPFVIRTEGQIRGNRTGRFTLATGQAKLVPILFRVPAHLGHFQFIGEDGKNYDFVGDSAEFVVAIYGADNPTKVRVRLSDGQDWKPNFEMEYC